MSGRVSAEAAAQKSDLLPVQTHPNQPGMKSLELHRHRQEKTSKFEINFNVSDCFWYLPFFSLLFFSVSRKGACVGS